MRVFPDDKIKGILSLINRSPDVGDGWRRVSRTVWPHVKDMPDDLAETREDSDGRYIRMTSEGRAVLKYA